MNAAIIGWSTITAAGVGGAALRRRLSTGRPAEEPVAVTGGPGPDGPLPRPAVHVLPGFDVRAELGRRGTSSFDRATALAVVCARDALLDAGLGPAADPDGPIDPARIGVALGTTVGSFRSTSDYSRETLVQDKPYLVNPMLFPNTVMNGAAGQVAIRLGLRGVNATITGGPLAFLHSARYASMVLERGYADAMLIGAVEEFSPHRAWAHRIGDPRSNVGTGEAAGFLVLAGVGAAGPRLRAVAIGYGPGGGPAADDALAGCVRRVLASAGAGAGDVRLVVTGESRPDERAELGPVTAALGREPARLLVAPLFGRCDAAAGAVAAAAALAAGSGPVLLTARNRDGAVGAALVEGGTGARTDRL